jgi:hypothetical protein
MRLTKLPSMRIRGQPIIDGVPGQSVYLTRPEGILAESAAGVG